MAKGKKKGSKKNQAPVVEEAPVEEVEITEEDVGSVEDILAPETVEDETVKSLAFTLKPVAVKPKSTYTREESKYNELLNAFISMESPMCESGITEETYVEEYAEKAATKLERVRRQYQKRANKLDLPIKVHVGGGILYLRNTGMEQPDGHTFD